MPYIKPDRRRSITEPFRPVNAGELNYAITQLLVQYARNGMAGYLTYNDCLGALEGAKLEFYRRVVVPYEEQKRAENGDVY